MDIDIIIKNIKEMLVHQEIILMNLKNMKEKLKEKNFIDTRILEFHTSNTTIIFAMTK